LAIRHGLGEYPGLNATWLTRRVGTDRSRQPQLLRRSLPIREPSDCLAFSLLHRSGRSDCPLWFEAHGVEAAPSKEGPAFSDEHLIVAAAVAGQGLVNLWINQTMSFLDHTLSRINSESDFEPVLRMMSARCFSTVRWLMPRSAAMILLGCAARTRSMIKR
jgi:hypothetical protein